MTAMGIIGIVLSGAMAAFMVVICIYALVEKYFSEKRRTTKDIIDYAVEAYSEECQNLFRNIMKDASEMVPDMTKACMKSFEENEEL